MSEPEVKKGEPLENGTPIASATWMSINSRGGLKDREFRFLEEVIAFSDEELLAIPRVGPDTVERIRRWQRGEEQLPPARPGDDEREEREFIAYAAHRATGTAPEAAKRKAVKIVEEFDRLKGGSGCPDGELHKPWIRPDGKYACWRCNALLKEASPGKLVPFLFTCDACGAVVSGSVWVPESGKGEVQGFPCPNCPATYTVERTA